MFPVFHISWNVSGGEGGSELLKWGVLSEVLGPRRGGALFAHLFATMEPVCRFCAPSGTKSVSWTPSEVCVRIHDCFLKKKKVYFEACWGTELRNYFPRRRRMKPPGIPGYGHSFLVSFHFCFREANAHALIMCQVYMVNLSPEKPSFMYFSGSLWGGEWRWPSISCSKWHPSPEFIKVKAHTRFTQRQTLAGSLAFDIDVPPLFQVLPERADFHMYRATICFLLPVQLSPNVFLEIHNRKKTEDGAGNLTVATFEHSLPLEEC